MLESGFGRRFDGNFMKGTNPVMTNDAKAKELHDRATRGKALTADEQVQLQAWYSEQDQAEFQQLRLSASATDDAELPDKIASTLNHIAATTAQIQKLAGENEALRRENHTLRSQLADQPLLQHA